MIRHRPNPRIACMIVTRPKSILGMQHNDRQAPPPKNCPGCSQSTSQGPQRFASRCLERLRPMPKPRKRRLHTYHAGQESIRAHTHAHTSCQPWVHAIAERSRLPLRVSFPPRDQRWQQAECPTTVLVSFGVDVPATVTVSCTMVQAAAYGGVAVLEGKFALPVHASHWGS